MNNRERFNAIMHYQPFDRCLLVDFNFWAETLPEWYKQGLPTSVVGRNSHRYFGLDASLSGGDQGWEVGVNVDLAPGFEWKVVEDRGDHEVVQQGNGVRVLRKKYMSSIPHPESHLLTDRASWKEHFLPRYDPNHPDRWKDFDKFVAKITAPRDHPLILWAGSLFGSIRDMMGMENVAFAVYDDPAFFQEMVDTRANCILECLKKVLATGVKFDSAHMWEDMAYNAGPLLSPQHFKQYLVPNYRKIADLLRSYGVDVLSLDCDGKIDDLVPLWLDAGVNAMFPIEVGTWNADPVKFRQTYGQNLLLFGGFDKHALQATPAKIEAEIKRLAPLVESGGFIPMPDHRVPPDVPFPNYVFYCQKAREIWGKNIDLPPIGVTG